MRYPAFFDAVPGIRLFDPLAAFLGAAEDGIIDYGYADAVRLAGHSCPTVASAYWLTKRALDDLFGDAVPERGGIRVEVAADYGEGVAGVIASVISLLTGAAGEGGFKGLAGRYQRRNLLRFAAPLPLEIRYTRLDGKGRVDAAADLGRVPADPDLGGLLQQCLAGKASSGERIRFAALWQDRVRTILLDHGNDPDVFKLRRPDV